MNEKRYNAIMDGAKLETKEVLDGWHFCQEFDGLLVGPGMSELQFCKCVSLAKIGIEFKSDENELIECLLKGCPPEGGNVSREILERLLKTAFRSGVAHARFKERPNDKR